MSTAPQAHLLQSVSSLCAPLHAAFDSAAKTAKEIRHHASLEHADYDWLGTHLTRANAHSNLREAAPDGWKLVGNHRRNGELWLAQGLMTLRLLHTWSESYVPAPGPNGARQAFYSNTPLPGMEDEHEQLALVDASRLLGLWRVVDQETSRVGIRVVRTVGAWTFHQRAKTDLNVLLPREVEDFAGLEWLPDDTGMPIDIPADDSQEGEDGGRAE